MRDVVLGLLIAGVAYVVYRMTTGDKRAPMPLGEPAQLSDTARSVAMEDVQLTAAQTTIRPRATLADRVEVARTADAAASTIADGDTSSTAAGL